MKVIFAFILSIVFAAAFGQTKIASVKLSGAPVNAYVDRVGELFIMTSDGQVQRYSKEGKILATYKGETTTLFDPRDGARLFTFSRDNRRVSYLSPTFSVTQELAIDSAFVIEPWLAFTSGDYNLWIVDAADGTLKKLNPKEPKMLFEAVLPDAERAKELTTGREYQGFVFLLDPKKGIQVFNSMGKWTKTLAGPAVPYFNFLGEELYYPEKGKLVFINLFNGEKRSISMPSPFDYSLITDERMYIVNGKTADFFRLNP